MCVLMILSAKNRSKEQKKRMVWQGPKYLLEFEPIHSGNLPFQNGLGNVFFA